MALGQTIKKLRKARNWSQDKLSEMTGGIASQGAISNLEKRDSTSSEFTEVIAKAFNVSIYELLGSSDPHISKIDDTQRNDIADRAPPTINKLIGLVANAIGANLSDADKRQLILQFTELVNSPSEHEQISRIISLVLDGSKKNNTQQKLQKYTSSEGQ